MFESHLQYGTQLWGQKNNETLTTFQKLQHHGLRKITFKRRYDCYKLCMQRIRNTGIPRHPKSIKLYLYVPNPAQPQTQCPFPFSSC